MTAQLDIDALRMALRRGFVKPDAVIHTDRGSQYASTEFRKLLAGCKLSQSMSDKGNCYDNAQAESLFSRFKTELDVRYFNSAEEARSMAFDYIDCYYSRAARSSSMVTRPESLSCALNARNDLNDSSGSAWASMEKWSIPPPPPGVDSPRREFAGLARKQIDRLDQLSANICDSHGRLSLQNSC